MDTRKKDVTEAAKEVRAALRREWHAAKFSVKSRRYSGGSSVEVTWTDGPTEAAVSKAVEHFAGYENGYYNEFVSVARSTSHETMEAAAAAVARYYGVPIPQVHGDDRLCPHVTDMTMVGEKGEPVDLHEPLCDKVHRAARQANLYNVTPERAFEVAYPC